MFPLLNAISCCAAFTDRFINTKIGLVSSFSRILTLICFIPLFTNAQFQKDIKFIENKGQWDESIKFAASFPGGKMLLHKSSISYVLENGHGRHRHDANNSRQQTSKTFKTASQEVEFLNAKSNAEILPANAGKERYNFYTGKSRDRWASGCKAYSSVTYKELYEGVDLKFYVDDNSLKYDLLLKKGSDPAQIKLKYHGQEMMTLEGGCAFASTPFGTITENAPVAYHVDEQHQKSVLPCKFILEDKVLSFSFPEGYDPEQRLVIDPELIFSTFSGAVSDNFGYTACFDDKGNLFSGGIIFGPDLSTGEVNGTYGGNYDMAILKYDSTGSDLLYATIIGGSNSEAPHSMIVNNNDELVILGTTGSDNFPISTNAYDSTFNGGNSFHIFEAYPDGSDIVLAKLGSSGNLVSSTFIGGPGNDGILKMNAVGNYLNQLIQNYGDYQRGDVIVDDEDNIYVASSTDSNGFPVSSAIQNTYQGGHSDAVAFSLNADLSQFRWGTYLGGTNDDAAYSIKINDQDQLLIGGGTLGAGFPTTAGTLHPAHRGEIDGFITKIDLAGDSLVQSTFLGTSAYDQVYMIDIDENQNVYAVGQTRGSYPVSNDVFAIPNSGQFIHKLTPDLSTTLFSTVFGSGTNEPNISPTAFLASQCGNLLLSGWGGVVNYTNSSNKGTTYGLPVTDNALFTETDGSDFYLMVLSSDGKELIYATFFGAENTTDGDHVDGGTSRFDKRGIIYQSVCSCGGSQDNFPTTPGAWSRVNRGISNGIGRCNNAAFKFDLASLRSKFQVNPPEGCAPLTVTFSNISNGGEEHLWMFGDGVTTQNRLHVEHTYEEAGTYNVSLLIKDNSTCIGEDISTQTIVVYDDQITVSPAVEICEGETVQLQATGGTSYEWNPPAGLNNRTLPNPLASPEESTTYTVSVITENGCEKEDVVPVTVIPAITKDLEVRRINNCDGAPQFSFTNNTDYDGSFTWDFGDGTTSEEQNPTHTYQREGEYTVNLDIQPLPECIIDKEITIDFQDLFIPNVFTPNNDNKNDFFEIRSDMELDLQVFNRKGKEVFSSDNYQNNWDGDGLRAGVYYYNLTLPNEDVCNGWVQILK